MKKVRIGPSFISAAKDVVEGTGGYSGKFGDEEVYMLLFDGKGVVHFIIIKIMIMITIMKKFPSFILSLYILSDESTNLDVKVTCIKLADC